MLPVIGATTGAAIVPVALTPPSEVGLGLGSAIDGATMAGLAAWIVEPIKPPGPLVTNPVDVLSVTASPTVPPIPPTSTAAPLSSWMIVCPLDSRTPETDPVCSGMNGNPVVPDAIAVVVSEETGAISMAVGGKIERDLSVEQLRERLSGELRRYMAPVALPTVGPLSDDSDAVEGSALRASVQMGADGDSEAETERPL